MKAAQGIDALQRDAEEEGDYEAVMNEVEKRLEREVLHLGSHKRMPNINYLTGNGVSISGLTGTITEDKDDSSENATSVTKSPEKYGFGAANAKHQAVPIQTQTET